MNRENIKTRNEKSNKTRKTSKKPSILSIKIKHHRRDKKRNIEKQVSERKIERDVCDRKMP